MFPLCVSSRVAAVHLGGGITVCAILMMSYRPVPRSGTTSTRTSMGSCGSFLGQALGGTRAHQSEAVDWDVGVAVRVTFSCEAR